MRCSLTQSTHNKIVRTFHTLNPLSKIRRTSAPNMGQCVIYSAVRLKGQFRTIYLESFFLDRRGSIRMNKIAIFGSLFTLQLVFAKIKHRFVAQHHPVYFDVTSHYNASRSTCSFLVSI